MQNSGQHPRCQVCPRPVTPLGAQDTAGESKGNAEPQHTTGRPLGLVHACCSKYRGHSLVPKAPFNFFHEDLPVRGQGFPTGMKPPASPAVLDGNSDNSAGEKLF